jgi:peroxiredoxin Q/BCP
LKASAPVRVGDPAPDFTLPAATGEPIRLSQFRGRSAVVLFFYPKDHSLICTAEACSFRDSFEALQSAGAEVIGVSADTVESHRQFAARNRLPFLLLSDTAGSVRARYGVPRTLGIIPGRVTYLIDREGIVRHIVSSQFQPAWHVAEVLRAVDGIRGQGQM